MKGFEVLEERMEKVGIRGTATGRIKFTDMYVPKENILGPVGKGLKVALTVLDFGRTTFGASCTGAAKFCLERMVARANSRRQFGKTLGEFQLVKGKIAEAAADTYAMESATYHTAAMIDSGAGGLHGRNGDDQGFCLRSAVANRQRLPANLGREGLFHRSAVRTNDAGCAVEPDRRRRQRRASLFHRRRRLAPRGQGSRRHQKCADVSLQETA